MASDFEITMDILTIFGEASGLKTNMAKSSLFPIHFAVENLDTIHNLLPCVVANFPCKYLGVPLSFFLENAQENCASLYEEEKRNQGLKEGPIQKTPYGGQNHAYRKESI
jgi:hypothetical protein